MTKTNKRQFTEADGQRLLDMIDNRKAIEHEIYEAIQEYTWEWDDDEAAKIEQRWRDLETKRDEAQKEIERFMGSFKAA